MENILPELQPWVSPEMPKAVLDSARRLSANVNESLPSIGTELEIPLRGDFFIYELLGQRNLADTIIDIRRDMKASARGRYVVASDEVVELILPPSCSADAVTFMAFRLSEEAILPASRCYNMHVNLGGISYSNDAQILARALEIYGGSDSVRLNEPGRRTKDASPGRDKNNLGVWSQYGSLGAVRPRYVTEENFHSRFAKSARRGQYDGIEIRSLVYTGPRQLYRTLRTAQLLGKAIMDKQAGVRPDVWDNFSVRLETTLTDLDIQVTADHTKLLRPQDDEDWTRYVDLLCNSEWFHELPKKAEPEMRQAATVVQGLRKIIQNTCHEVMASVPNRKAAASK